MATAYAALLSLFHTLNQINIHPRPPISLDQSQVESLTQNLTFLQQFLECYPTYDLESRITSAAYAAEDVIETRIVDQIHHATSTTDLYGDLERLIQDMDFIKKDVMEIMQQKMMMRGQDLDLQHTYSSVSGGPASTLQSSTTPVFDDAIITQVLDKLVGQQSSLQIVPIVGMGGIGKTTLATSIYAKPLILQHFDTLVWVTISQEYSRRNILQLLCQELKVSIDDLSQKSEDEIGLALYQHLFGRRYLIVLDDIWTVEAWYMIKSYFPEHNNGSRIMITTRLSNLASDLSGCHDFQMQFLDENKSWDLLCDTVFGKQDCPTKLEDIGKQIARKCRGLPLSIGVIGGLLRNSNMTRTYWIYTLENLNSLVNLENDEYAFRVLRTSYNELPMHLKPCFLYMGIFPEDEEIRTSMLIRLWVVEGILRPVDEKSLEEVAKEYLKELIDRNLVLVSKLRWNGEAKVCKIHDVLRDVCLREAQKQKFFCVLRQQRDHIPQDINMERRICINSENAYKAFNREFLHAVESASLTRSLLYCMRDSWCIDSPSVHLGLLKVYSSVDDQDHELETHSKNAIFKHANLRYLSLKLESEAVSSMRSLCCLLWNLQILTVGHQRTYSSRTISEIWEMPLLKHVKFDNFVLPDPPNGERSFVLKYLETLSGVMNLKFSEEVIKRIPNIKKLKLTYQSYGKYEEELPDFSLNNIGRLQKLESLNLHATYLDIRCFRYIKGNLVSFPRSLEKLSLRGTRLSWEELTMRIGSLPLLQLLKLDSNACRGPKWETVEGQFCSLKLLQLSRCYDLKYWETDSAHFPRLEYLHLSFINSDMEIPSSIGDIPTLKEIQLFLCSKSVQHSAKRIKVEQQENGNEDLQVGIDWVAVQVDSDVEDEADLDEDDQVDLDEDDQEDDQVDLDIEEDQEDNQVDRHG